MRTNRYLPLVVATLVLLVGVAGWARTGQIIHIVTEGGPDADFVGPGGDYNASLVAVMADDGSVMGQWQDNLYSGSRRPINFHARIICLSVEGTEAWVVGQITAPPFWRDLYVLQGLRDLGGAAGDPPDQITYLYIDPETIGPDSCNNPPAFAEWLDYSRGQIRVE